MMTTPRPITTLMFGNHLPLEIVDLVAEHVEEYQDQHFLKSYRPLGSLKDFWHVTVGDTDPLRSKFRDFSVEDINSFCIRDHFSAEDIENLRIKDCDR